MLFFSRCVGNIAGMNSENELSPTMRGYLAEIYRLQENADPDEPYVSTSALADVLFVSPPAVNRMVGKLKEMGYLHHEPYQGISLTQAGNNEALLELRRHRIIEAFLVTVMNFGWHEVHHEAHLMSSGTSEILLQRMLEMAGQPTTCPHGEPIPDANGVLPKIHDERLNKADIGQDLQITRVTTREPDRLEYLEALGLTPGRKIHLLHKAPFNGPLQLKIGDEFRIIGDNLAHLIRVTPAENQ